MDDSEDCWVGLLGRSQLSLAQLNLQGIVLNSMPNANANISHQSKDDYISNIAASNKVKGLKSQKALGRAALFGNSLILELLYLLPNQFLLEAELGLAAEVNANEHDHQENDEDNRPDQHEGGCSDLEIPYQKSDQCAKGPADGEHQQQDQ